MKFKFSCLPLLLVLVFCFPPGILAHGPFDNSSQLIVRDDTLELVVTMGMDGSRQFLLNAGLSDADATTVLAGRGPSTLFALPMDLAPKFFDVSVGGKALAARNVTVITDGLEAAFNIAYSRPAEGGLALRALYFGGIEAMKPGSFIAMDENRNGLGAAMITRDKPMVEIKLAVAATVLTNVVVVSKSEPPASPDTNAAAVNKAPFATALSRRGPTPFVWLFALALALTGLWIVVRKWISFPLR